MFALLRVMRGISGFIFAWGVLGLFPVLSWLQDLSAVNGAMLGALLLKLLQILLFGGLFLGLRSIINGLHQRKHGIPHPALAEKRFAL